MSAPSASSWLRSRRAHPAPSGLPASRPVRMCTAVGDEVSSQHASGAVATQVRCDRVGVETCRWEGGGKEKDWAK